MSLTWGCADVLKTTGENSVDTCNIFYAVESSFTKSNIMIVINSVMKSHAKLDSSARTKTGKESARNKCQQTGWENKTKMDTNFRNGAGNMTPEARCVCVCVYVCPSGCLMCVGRVRERELLQHYGCHNKKRMRFVFCCKQGLIVLLHRYIVDIPFVVADFYLWWISHYDKPKAHPVLMYCLL